MRVLDSGATFCDACECIFHSENNNETEHSSTLNSTRCTVYSVHITHQIICLTAHTFIIMMCLFSLQRDIHHTIYAYINTTTSRKKGAFSFHLDAFPFELFLLVIRIEYCNNHKFIVNCLAEIERQKELATETLTNSCVYTLYICVQQTCNVRPQHMQ